MDRLLGGPASAGRATKDRGRAGWVWWLWEWHGKVAELTEEINTITLSVVNHNQMKNYQISFSTSILLAHIALTTGSASANELRLPSKISCANGSVTIEQISPAKTYEQTTTAAFTLSVNGNSEAATGLQNGNVSKVASKSYYVFSGTGGLTFASHRGKPYFGNDGNAKVICTNSKYGYITPGFDAKY